MATGLCESGSTVLRKKMRQKLCGKQTLVAFKTKEY